MFRHIYTKFIFPSNTKRYFCVKNNIDYDYFFTFNTMIDYDNDRGIDKMTYIYTHDVDNLKNKKNLETYIVYGNYKITFLHLNQLKTNDEWNKLNAYVEHYKRMENLISIKNIKNINIDEFEKFELIRSIKNDEKDKIISYLKNLDFRDKKILDNLSLLNNTKFYEYNKNEQLTIQNIRDLIK